ncbi:MAG: amidohydrolase family protein [Kordiimonadaceae bacterium]|nr:amidohydrolase family protein [Kordiimonadaceae bacterium]MBO6569338.1 amidohydrolase family protein [Kordiimonadaceae bacterium]MBO6964813.1 amidohydrolase family protein [Kordiimonadaceae bacterium]
MSAPTGRRPQHFVAVSDAAVNKTYDIAMLCAMGAQSALDVATRHGAYFVGALDDIGTLEIGKLADLVVLNSNPLDDIRNKLEIDTVMHGGILRDGDTLDEVWPLNMPFGPVPWENVNIYGGDNRPTDHHQPN